MHEVHLSCSCCTHKTTSKNEKYLSVGAGILFVITLGLEYQIFGFGVNQAYWLMLAYLISYVILGHGILKEAFLGLIKRDYFNENTLMAIASLGAWLIGEGAEAVAILLFYRVGENLQNRIVEKTKTSIKSLQSMKIDTIRVLRNNEKLKIHPKDVQVGDEVIVFAGERIGVDGIVLQGESHLDLSMLNGESLPSAIKEGEDVLSGSINLDGTLHIKALKSYQESTFAQVIRLIEEGQAQKSRSEEFITRFARFYTPIVTILALLIAFVPPLYLGMAAESFFEGFTLAFSDWFSRGLIFLVISCPCALVISIPLSFFVSLGRASEEGILIKGSSYLESLYHAKKIIFDKTGTITQGELKIVNITAYGAFNQEDILALAKSLEEYSNHPIAQAILKSDGSKSLQPITQITEQAGGGIKGFLDDKELMIGNRKFIEQNHVQGAFEEDERCQVFLAYEKQLIGVITLEDTIKAEAKSALEELKGLGIQEIYMLSGDKASVVSDVAKRLDIHHYYAELLPQGKVEKLKDILQEQRHQDSKVIFVGDGINDAPSLALSDIGIAMGRGSDIALEGANVVIMNDHLSKIPLALKIAQKTRQILWQNITFALGTKAIIMICGALGLANMWLALMGDVGVALLALLNAMRGLKK